MTEARESVLESGVRGGQLGTAVPLARIYIDENGDLVVTDLWEEVALLVGAPCES